MSDDDRRRGRGEEGPGTLSESATQPMDEVDAALLREVADLLTTVDPVPAGLVERVQFSLALDEVYAEVAQITRMPMDALAVRSDPAAGIRTETLTFSAGRLTAMVTVSRPHPESVRVDGWIAPPGRMRVRLRLQGSDREVVSDESGRFVVEGLPEGFAQLSFHGLEEGADEAVVVTPVFEL